MHRKIQMSKLKQRERYRGQRVFRMNIAMTRQDRDILNQLAESTGYSLSATIGMAIREMAQRLESGYVNND